MHIANISLSYKGGLADESELDFYDVSQALVGFQRSLALTTHLVLNDEIIVQAPSLKGAKIFAVPPEEGSWKITAAIITAAAVGTYHVTTAPRDTPLGHLVSSAYDYVISESLGFHVDYDKTLGQQFEEFRRTKRSEEKTPITPSRSQLDSLIEKCEFAIKEMHRPISKSETATQAIVTSQIGSRAHRIGHPLNLRTYEYIAYTERSPETFEFTGLVSSYNLNTFKGRVYLVDEQRPVPFELAETARGARSIVKITNSLSANAQKNEDDAIINFDAFRNLSRTGRLKGLYVTKIF